MKLSKEQLAQFDELGYLILPEIYSMKEVEVLRKASADALSSQREEVWREKNGIARMAFGCHTYNKTCEKLIHDTRLIDPVEDLFGEKTYLYQFKINAKSSFNGDVWQWHQDFPVWHKEDGMSNPRAMNVAIFLDEVMPINGALMLVPRSHKEGAQESTYDDKTTSYPLWIPDNETVTKLVDKNGIFVATGKPGTVLMFHSNILHASACNITPYPRRIVYLTLAALSNTLVNPTRPEYVAHRSYEPVKRAALTELVDLCE